MPFSISQKLKIKAGEKLLTLNAPSDFKKVLGELPLKVSISNKTVNYTQLHWFVLDKEQMERELIVVIEKIRKPGITCWIYFPKGTSKIQTDLTRDKGWDKLMNLEGFRHLGLISLNDTWSAFAIKWENEKSKPKPSREIFNWVDPATKNITLPSDLEGLLRKNKKAMSFFEKLSFTNKKEYIEWIVTAKKEETRSTRLGETINRLSMEWKNPRNI